MAKKKSGTLVKVIAIIAAVLVIVFAVGMIYRFTNGFNEDFKTFYVEHDGKQVLSAESTTTLKRGEEHRFDVKYTFDFVTSETRDYSVKVVSHAQEPFAYYVNDREYLYQDGIDLTAAFDIKKEDTYFTVKISNGSTLQTVLQALNKDKTVAVDETIEGKQPYLYTLVISSYNKSITYQIHFAIHIPVQGIYIDGAGDSLLFGGNV